MEYCFVRNIPRFEVTMPHCPGCPCPGWIDFHTCLRGDFDERILYLSSWQEVPSTVALVRSDWKQLLVAARHTHVAWFGWKCPNCWDCYPVILPSKRRIILLANCLQEAECVNSQITPCNTIPSGWPLCQCSGTLCGMLQSSGKRWWILLRHGQMGSLFGVCTFSAYVVHVLSCPWLYRWTLNQFFGDS